MRLLILIALVFAGCSNPLPTPSCSDGIKDGDETDVDCGGSCPACAGGKACLHGSDCRSGSCLNNVCAGGVSGDLGVADASIGCVNNQQCNGLPHATGVCGADGHCAISNCDSGFADCDKAVVNGCEVSLATDVANCGSCGNACGTVVNGTAVCKAGVCAIGACNTGFANCDGLFASGCKTAVTGDVDNCGACARVCTAPNGKPACMGGTCSIASCATGFADCDGNAANGCETSLTGDPMNCGGCGHACMTPANAMALCQNSTCSVGQRQSGHAHCTMNPADGCETNIVMDALNCGHCGNVCPTPANATAGCSTGMCGIATCNSLYGDCDHNPANGCEASLATDVANCGTCGQACAYANGIGVCSNGQCGLQSCNAGFADCDKNPANGCETNVQFDANNCGACGTVCMGNTPNCVNGVCSAGLPPPSVLVCTADANSNAGTMIQTLLQNTGAFASVSVLNCTANTPTLAQLNTYDVVFTWDDNQYADTTTLGNNLADFVDGGGGVVLAQYDLYNQSNGVDYQLGGRWTPNYNCIQPSLSTTSDSLTMTPLLPGSPLVTGVTKFTSYNVGTTYLPAPGAVAVWNYQGGEPAIVSCNVNGHPRVDLNFYPYPNNWTGDGATIIKNALLYVQTC